MKLYNLICAHCGKGFFGRKNQKHCSKRCRDLAGYYRKKGRCKIDEDRKNRERNERLKERDRKAAEWLGKDAEGNTRGIVPGGNTHRNCDGLFGRWY